MLLICLILLSCAYMVIILTIRPEPTESQEYLRALCSALSYKEERQMLVLPLWNNLLPALLNLSWDNDVNENQQTAKQSISLKYYLKFQ